MVSPVLRTRALETQPMVRMGRPIKILATQPTGLTGARRNVLAIQLITRTAQRPSKLGTPSTTLMAAPCKELAIQLMAPMEPQAKK